MSTFPNARSVVLRIDGVEHRLNEHGGFGPTEFRFEPPPLPAWRLRNREAARRWRALWKTDDARFYHRATRPTSVRARVAARR